MTEINDTGQRVESTTGALSDPGHSQIAFELLSPFSLFDLATWLGKGAEKYAPRNWEKGIPFSVCIGKLFRHAAKFQMGLTDEDHLSAVGFWWHALAHYREMIVKGVLPANLDDLPKYKLPAKTETVPGQAGKPKSPVRPGFCMDCKYGSLPATSSECSGCYGTEKHKDWEPANA